VIFLHIPKCGGTSLHTLLASNFHAEDMCPERHTLDEWTPQSLARYRYYSGHFTYSSLDKIAGERDIVTMFREPKARLRSFFYFVKSHRIERLHEYYPELADIKHMSLKDYLRAGAPRGPSAVQQIGDGNLALAIDRLSTFAAIGILENGDDSFRSILRRLSLRSGVERIPHEMAFTDLTKYSTIEAEPTRREDVDDECRQLLADLTRDEVILYDAAIRKAMIV
jgi:hypothetical protein